MPRKSEFGRPVVNSCLTLVDRRRHERQRRQPEGDRQSRLDRHQADRRRSSSATRSMPNPRCWPNASRRSGPDQGIVTVRTTGKKADGTVFMTYERSVLVPKRGHAVDESADYPERTVQTPVFAHGLGVTSWKLRFRESTACGKQGSQGQSLTRGGSQDADEITRCPGRSSTRGGKRAGTGGDRNPVVARHGRQARREGQLDRQGFNKTQSDYKVVPVFKGSYAETMTAAIAAYRAGSARDRPGLRGRHRDDDGRQGRGQAGLPADGRRRRAVRPERPICRR